MDAYLMMAHQTVQKLLTRNKKRNFTGNEACMHAKLCDLIAADAELRTAFIKKQQVGLNNDSKPSTEDKNKT